VAWCHVAQVLYYTRSLKHIEALWFANVANQILWWTYVKACWRALSSACGQSITFKTTLKVRTRLCGQTQTLNITLKGPLPVRREPEHATREAHIQPAGAVAGWIYCSLCTRHGSVLSARKGSNLSVRPSRDGPVLARLGFRVWLEWL
jgi:hypothetical protein